MINKQTLVLPHADDEEIIRVAGNSSSYVDESYFEDKMKEKGGNKKQAKSIF
jgi:hypothetical protein